MSENFAEMFEQSITQMNMRVGEIITGEVVDINRDVWSSSTRASSLRALSP